MSNIKYKYGSSENEALMSDIKYKHGSSENVAVIGRNYSSQDYHG